MLPFWNDYYYLILIAQLVCIVHAMKNGKKDWIYILLFLPGIGAIAYFIREIWPTINGGQVTSNLQELFVPGHNIKELERKVRLSDTVANKLALANAYAHRQEYQRAIELAQSCLNAHHANDQGILLLLARLYFYNEQYFESVSFYNRLLGMRNFRMTKQEDELLYARALEGSTDYVKAEEEYKKVIRVHHSMEAMYYYGMMLKKQQRTQDAKAQFQAVKDEIELHPGYVRRLNTQWVRRSRREMADL
ncbi:hypothetical protein [Chitinophaga filiformis]|uniref:Tetratricopeptide repeat-containing protein n=1 Tax=Chitinophaga filiformis TaxID=104663 RepID=A0A1G7ICQ7_CHIFI|nr:hypothetical protein [Chitinophaga filiformis]SDF10413.1 hypothetical protein SAMN04488121_101800 [Chitinophaga filiformis]